MQTKEETINESTVMVNSFYALIKIYSIYFTVAEFKIISYIAYGK